MQGIFVSYRRQDSQSAAGRLSDHLREHLASVPIFRDVETIEPGVDFVEAIGRALKSCKVLLAVIGPRWATITDENGQRRLDNVNDYTRLEIATALKRSDVRVIPVLVEGAQMPGAEALPEDLAALARRNAVELSDKRWDYDVSQLQNTLRGILGLPDPEPVPAPAPHDRPAPVPARNWKLWGAAALLAIGVVVYLAEDQSGDSQDAIDYTADAHPAALPAAAADTSAGERAVSNVQGSDHLPMLAGLWHDNLGGRFEIAQQGNQLVIQGAGPDGYVSGSATLQGRRGQGAYTLNGYPLQSSFVVSDDDSRLDVSIRDPATGNRDSAVLLRLR